MKWSLDRNKLKLTVGEIRDLVAEEELEFPKYATPVLNLANRFAQATRPKIVGQMSELIEECPYKDFEGWKNGIWNNTLMLLILLQTKSWKYLRTLRRFLID